MIRNSSLQGDWDIYFPVEEKQELVHSKISKFLNLRKGLLTVSMSQKKRKRQEEDGSRERGEGQKGEIQKKSIKEFLLLCEDSMF